MASCDVELFISHVNADNAPFGADHLRQHINILSSSAAEIQNVGALQMFGCDETAAVVFGANFFVHIGERLAQARGNGGG